MEQVMIGPIPANKFQVVLDGQYCTITLRQKGNRMYLDLEMPDRIICKGAICVNGASIVQSQSIFFSGSLHFIDVLGDDAPWYELINERYFLIYINGDEKLPELLRF